MNYELRVINNELNLKAQQIMTILGLCLIKNHKH